MSTSFIYHALGCIGYQYLKARYKKSKIFIFIRKQSGKIRCPECDSYKIIFKGTKTRHFKSVPRGGDKCHPFYIILIISEKINILQHYGGQMRCRLFSFLVFYPNGLN
jgi:DNA-directed RNA polymerase subunit RPC12/RpoP